MVARSLALLLLFFLGLWTSCFAHQKSYYGGVYEGSCGQNGIYYKDTKGFMICSNNHGYYMRCPTGTKNSPESSFAAGNYYSNADFCGVIVNVFGNTRDDFLDGKEETSEETGQKSSSSDSSVHYMIAKKDEKRGKLITDHSNADVSPGLHLIHAVHKQKPATRSTDRKKKQSIRGHTKHKQTFIQTQESPESFMRKVIEVSKSARKKNRAQSHESSYETMVSEQTEISTKSKDGNKPPGISTGPSAFQSITQQHKHHDFTNGQGPNAIAKSIESGLKQTMSKIFEEAKTQTAPESLPGNHVVSPATTHTYHHPGGIVRTFEHAKYHHPTGNRIGRSNSLPAPQFSRPSEFASLAPIPEPPVVHFSVPAQYNFPEYNPNVVNGHKIPNPGVYLHMPDMQRVGNAARSHFMNYLGSGQPQSNHPSQSRENSAVNNANGNSINSYGVHSLNVYNPPIPNASLVAGLRRPEAPKPFDAENYLHADFYGRSAEDFKQTLPYLPGAFDAPQNNHQHQLYQPSFTESYSINMESNPEGTQTTISTNDEPSHVHVNTPYPFPRNALNFNQNHLDFEKYSAQFGYRPYYGIHGNANIGHNFHHHAPEALIHQTEFSPIEDRQAPLPPTPLPVQNGDQKENSYSFQESYSEKKSESSDTMPDVPATHGTKSFVTQKSEYINVNGKTVKDYTSTVYGVHTI